MVVDDATLLKPGIVFIEARIKDNVDLEAEESKVFD